MTDREFQERAEALHAQLKAVQLGLEHLLREVRASRHLIYESARYAALLAEALTEAGKLEETMRLLVRRQM